MKREEDDFKEEDDFEEDNFEEDNFEEDDFEEDDFKSHCEISINKFNPEKQKVIAKLHKLTKFLLHILTIFCIKQFCEIFVTQFDEISGTTLKKEEDDISHHTI